MLEVVSLEADGTVILGPEKWLHEAAIGIKISGRRQNDVTAITTEQRLVL